MTKPMTLAEKESMRRTRLEMRANDATILLARRTGSDAQFIVEMCQRHPELVLEAVKAVEKRLS